VITSFGRPLRGALALALLAQSFFLLALIGQLRIVPMLVLIALAIAVVIPSASEGSGWAGVAMLGLTAILLFALALRPPVAFDETLYHLPFVRELATSGRLRFLTDHRFPVFPQLQELLCVPLFIVGGGTATHLMSLIEVLLTAALLIDWGRRNGTLAAAIFLGSPLVVFLGTVTYVDAALTLFITGGFYCLDRRSPALAGVFFGTACSVKYLGGYFAVVALVVAAFLGLRSLMIYAGSCFAAALPTTLWLVVMTGNPVFPFFSSSPWNLTHEPTFNPRVLWDVTFARARVNHEPPITPFLIIALVVVLIAARRDVRARIVAVIVATFLIAFFFLPQDSRYLVPVLPLISVVAASAIEPRKWLDWIAIAPGIAYAAYLLATPPRQVPEVRALMRAGEATVYVCGAEQLKYFARGRLLGDFAGPYAYDRILTGDVEGNLRRIGAQYLLVAKHACTPPAGMVLVYQDDAAQLWRLQPSSPHRR